MNGILKQTQAEKSQERKLLWDEENRLEAIDENGFVSNYWYDATGERTVKTSGESEQMYVNGLFSGGNTSTANFTAYVNPYIVVSKGGHYTKHIYIGSQRIVSKLGDLDSYGADPRRIEYAGNNVDGALVNYKSKYEASQQTIKDRYAIFEVPYLGKDNDDYVNGQGFCCDDTPQGNVTKSAMQNDNPELFQYYYHSDHLGSTSLITNLDGEVVQHVEYVPFGEVFIEERNNTWNTPYLFNAKELDEETGLYYYGARYYDSRISIWLSADPLQEKYPNVSTYAYCSNNPINRIDPDGNADFEVKGKVIGNDGIDDGRRLVLKTKERSFGEGESRVDGAGLSRKEMRATVKFIKQNSGNTEPFQKNEMAYNNSIEIEGSSANRQAMVDEVSRDNGQGGTVEANNREYGGSIQRGSVVLAEPGAPADPSVDKSASIVLPDVSITFHSHPSGTKSEPVAGGTRNSSFNQHPSRTDIENASTGTHYVFGRGDKKVYVHTSGGVQAVIPMKRFVNPKR